MMQYACYSVISPEGCAAILHRNRAREHVARAAEALKLTAGDLLHTGAVDALVAEPAGGAHRNPRRALEAVEHAVLHALGELRRVSPLVLRRRRYEKYRRLGAHVEAHVAAPRAHSPRRRSIAKPKAVR
jgi:acetyl-CoA carboxylase carboxyl transferase subunit alpha